MFILQHLEIVERAEMEQILTLFESCDMNGDGVLDAQDLKTQLSRRTRVAASRAGSRVVASHVRPQDSFSRAAASAVAADELEREGTARV